jgi:hypothetical protein
LDELRHSRHGIGVDLDVRKQIGVSPAVSLGGCTTKLNADSTLDEFGNERLVGVARLYVPFLVVGVIVQGHMTSVGMKYGNDLRLGIPVCNVILQDLNVEERGWQIPFEGQSAHAEYDFHFRQLHGNVDVKRLG